MWLYEVVQPCGPSSFFKRDMQVAAQSLDKLQNGDRLRFDDGFHDQFPGGIHHGERDSLFVNVHPNVFCTFHYRCSLLLRYRNAKNLPPKERPFIMRSICLGIFQKQVDKNGAKTQCFLRKRLWKGTTLRFVTECSGIFS